MTVETFGIVLGVLGFALSVYNWLDALRSRTVKAQAELLAELRGHLAFALYECQTVRHQLTFDQHMLHTGYRPEIRRRPKEFDEAIARLPELSFTINSIGQRQIEMLHYLIKDSASYWDLLKSCTDSDPVNFNALDNANRLRRLCKMIEKFFPEYIDAVIDKGTVGSLWKRYKYRDHRPVVYRVFRWTPLQQAVNDYEKVLMEV